MGVAWILIQAIIVLFPTFWREVLGWPSNRAVEIIYAGMVRIPFGVFLVMPLLSVYFGFCKFLQFRPLFEDFLSGKSMIFVNYMDNRFWVVMGRLAFSVYLSHILTLVFVGSTLFERSPGTVGSLVSITKPLV